MTGESLPESMEVASERLLRRDHGPDLAVVMPREMWILVGAMLKLAGVAVTEDATPGTAEAVLFEMRDFAEYTISRAVKDAMLADAIAEQRGAFGGGM